MPQAVCIVIAGDTIYNHTCIWEKRQQTYNDPLNLIMTDLILITDAVYNSIICVEITDAVDELAIVDYIEQLKNLFPNRVILCLIGLGDYLTFHTFISSVNLLCGLIGCHFGGQLPWIQTQLFNNPQIITYQTFFKDFILGASTVCDCAEIHLLDSRRTKIAITKFGTGGQNAMRRKEYSRAIF